MFATLPTASPYAWDSLRSPAKCRAQRILKCQFPPPDYQIESVWYRDSKEVFRGVGMYRGSEVSDRAYHNRFGWSPPEGRLPEGRYRVELDVAGKQITSGDFAVQP